MFINFVQWRCSSRKVQKLKKINVITFENVCKFSSNLRKTLSMSRPFIPEDCLTFYFLPFFISHLSGNKLRNLPQGIFKGLKRLLIMWVEYEVHLELNLIELVSQYLLIIELISLRSTHQCTKLESDTPEMLIYSLISYLYSCL